MIAGCGSGSADFDSVRREVQAAGWRVRRAWPREAAELTLDLIGPEGSTAARWTSTDGLRLMPNGADPSMPALADLLTTDHAVLVSHRPRRRAVLRLDDRFAKVVPPKRHAALLAASLRAERLPVRTPSVVGSDPARGLVVTSALPGCGLAELLAGPRAVEACRSVGRLLAELHRLPGEDLPVHGPDEELAVLDRWATWASDWRVAPAYPLVRLPAAPANAQPRLVHRDAHDRQFLVADDETVGVIDFDLMAAGDPALDLANLLVHLELRERQGLVYSAQPLVDAVLEGYRPGADLVDRLPFYRATAWRRLAYVYAFRDPDLVS
jgi:Ser/Thr protein kinase RdoA (MazF antagonist)